MKTVVFVFGLLQSGLARADLPALDCAIGPAQMIFGGTSWSVYACNDQRSVAVVTASGSPAAPFYFFFAFDGGAYRLKGEGTGNKVATDAAFAELSKLGTADIVGLFREATKAAKK